MRIAQSGLWAFVDHIFPEASNKFAAVWMLGAMVLWAAVASYCYFGSDGSERIGTLHPGRASMCCVLL